MADADNSQPDQVANEAIASESLDGPESSLETSETNPSVIDVDADPAPSSAVPPANKPKRLQRLRRRFNVYTLLFILVIVLAVVISLIAYLQSRHAAKSSHFQTQTLSQSTLEQLANSDVTVGSNQSVLNVKSSAVFAGEVVIGQNLEVAGNLQIGGTVALSNIAVAGTSQFGQVNVSKNLAVAGDTAMQGGLTIAKNLQVSGGGTFGGALSAPQITTSSLQLNGDLVLTHHISAGGATPSRSGGSALGSGGSVSLSGSDTAGSITINTGGGPAAGCFVTVTFTAHYNATPHVLVTPIGSAAGGLSYYVNRSTTSFSICDATAPPTGSSFGFDYFVLD
jgi:cytoskeletal protein CcmA (bactofilin family)